MTEAIKSILQREVKFLSGVGTKKAEVLAKELNIKTLEDLLYYFPFKYIDKTKFYSVSEISADLPYIQLKGKFTGFRLEGQVPRQRLVGLFADESGTLEIVWFKGIGWAQGNYKTDVEYVVFGKPNVFNRRINLVHPDIEENATADSKINSSLESAYLTTEPMKKAYINSKFIHKTQYGLLKLVYNQTEESLPEDVMNEFRLISRREALRHIHFPENAAALQNAEFRLKFEELFLIQLNLLKLKNNRKTAFKGFVFKTVGDNFNTFYKENLPFELTGAQKRVIREIRHDTLSGLHMNRLLQGDVGSGKTLVALMVMLIALDNNFQACLMAPTEILAQQHLETLSEFLSGMEIKLELLTGSTRKKKRTAIHEQLQKGEINILIGTHALIEDTVIFHNLGMVIIDEQHRFGVAQRAKLWKKNTIPPHIIVMTATPIPRTLAMTVYGDLDVSVIDELPPGRIPIKTNHAFDSQRLRVFKFMRKQIAAGHQVYIVYPLIKESETLDYKDLEDGYESICRAFPSPQYAVSIVHGQMKAEEKEKSMQLFAKGQTQIMVATTVIEVGVNVPNASTMIIESAERFGLSQLHQLRGRVGRGAAQSHCILMTSYKLSKEAKKRINTMVDTTDGFRIAEVDMKLRGPGDMEGTQQSGVPFDLKIANLVQDSDILKIARNSAEKILGDDANLAKKKNQMLRKRLESLSNNKVNWSSIS